MNYYIQGNKEKADQIKAAFEKLGYNTGYLGFTSGQLYYTVEGKVELMCTKSLQNLIKTHPDYKELELPKSHYDISNFKPFDKVLVRCADDEEWAIEMFSKYYNSEPTIHGRTYRFMCIADSYTQCIPFEGNEHLLGTTDMCDEMYINW